MLGFDQLSRATVIGLLPSSFSNNENVQRPLYKAGLAENFRKQACKTAIM